MPVRVNVRVVLFLTIIGFILTACDQQQMQKISTAVSEQSSAVNGPFHGANTDGVDPSVILLHGLHNPLFVRGSVGIGS